MDNEINDMSFEDHSDECDTWFDDMESLSDECPVMDEDEERPHTDIICFRAGEEYCSFFCPFHKFYFND
jgi:hypothetical protein